MNENNQTSYSKVLFRVQNDDGTTEVETLWATHQGEDKYKLDNSPFYAYGVSWEDIVLAPFSKEEQFPTFQYVVLRSGNSTVRIVFEEPHAEGNETDLILKTLIGFGCSYEGSNKRYFAVNIPPSVNLEVVRNYLIEQNATWEHADPTYDSLFPSQ